MKVKIMVGIGIFVIILSVIVLFYLVKHKHKEKKLGTVANMMTIVKSIRNINKVGKFAGYIYVLTPGKVHAYFASNKASIFKKHKFDYSFFVSIDNISLSNRFFNRVCHQLKNKGLGAITIKVQNTVLLYKPVYCNKIFKGDEPILKTLPAMPMFWFN